MKIEKILEDAIRTKFSPRVPIFITRTKMLILGNGTEWNQNCEGLLIFYSFNTSYYFCILDIIKFEVLFDMELYTNFLHYAKFMGDFRSILFLLPAKSKILEILFVLQSKQELTDLKRILQSTYYKSSDEDSLGFFQRPEVRELIKAADIDFDLLQSNLRFRKEVENEIEDYFDNLNKIQKKRNNSGFKAYGMGRQQWKLQKDQVQFMKDKKREEAIDNLTRLYRQARMS